MATGEGLSRLGPRPGSPPIPDALTERSAEYERYEALHNRYLGHPPAPAASRAQPGQDNPATNYRPSHLSYMVDQMRIDQDRAPAVSSSTYSPSSPPQAAAGGAPSVPELDLRPQRSVRPANPTPAVEDQARWDAMMRRRQQVGKYKYYTAS